MIDALSVKPSLMLLIVATCMALGIASGMKLMAWRNGVVIAHLREAAAIDARNVAEHNSRALLDAQTRGDALTRQLAAATRAASRLRKERDDALQTATTGRVCLDAAALRVLDGAPGLAVALPTAAGGAAAADGAVATDTDVARWALGAGEQYEECRRRLDALIDFHTSEVPQ